MVIDRVVITEWYSHVSENSSTSLKKSNTIKWKRPWSAKFNIFSLFKEFSHLTFWHFKASALSTGHAYRNMSDLLELLKILLYMQYWGNISSRFSRNSEADASEFLENLEEMFRSQW